MSSIESFVVFALMLVIGISASILVGKLNELIQEIKAFRRQIQETLTPADLEGGHYGHPKATRQAVELILLELKKGR